MLCFHGSPLSYSDVIEPSTPDNELFRMLGGRSATVPAHGHTHAQTIRRVEAGFLGNPGTISECWDFTVRGAAPPFSPWAEFGVLDWSNSRPRLTLHRVTIDVKAVIAAPRYPAWSARRNGLPCGGRAITARRTWDRWQSQSARLE